MTRVRAADIVERLRKASVYEQYKAVLSNLGDEAADEIEKLRDQNSELLMSLQDLEERIGKDGHE